MKPDVSIIIPVHNVEQYLSRCIDSVLSQTFANWELLLVDDGSTDKSSSLCDEYKLKDVRIRVFHKENGGVSSARNMGLDYAKGEWISFVDSDDYLEPNMYEVMYAGTQCAPVDVVYCDYFQCFNNGKIRENVAVYDSDKRERLRAFLLKGWPVVWNKLYRRSFLEKNDITFQSKYNFCEDMLFTFEVLYHSNEALHIAQALYNYNRINEYSIVNTLWSNERMIRNIQDGIEVVNKIILFLKERNMYIYLERELAWSLLKAKVGYIYIKSKRNDYRLLYPGFNKYILSNPLTSRKTKLLQCLMMSRYLWWIIDLAILCKKNIRK